MAKSRKLYKVPGGDTLPQVWTTDNASTATGKPIEFMCVLEDVDARPKVQNYFKHKGITSRECASLDRHLLAFRGNSQEVLRAFNIGNRSTASARIDASLKGTIRSIIGSNTTTRIEPTVLPHWAHTQESHFRAPDIPPGMPVQTAYTVDDIRRAYDFPNGTGKNRQIGIIALDGGYDEGSIEKFFADRQKPAPRILTQRPNVNTKDLFSFLLTQTIEILGALLPDATLVVYNQSEHQTPYLRLVDMFYSAVHGGHMYGKNGKQKKGTVPSSEVIVNPWVLVENPYNTAGGIGIMKQDAVQSLEPIFEMATKNNITVCSASGNAGGMIPAGSQQTSKWPNVNYPASSPNVLAVGGTTLYYYDVPHPPNPNPPRKEYVWNRERYTMKLTPASAFSISNLGATGGGFSHFFARPSWQKSVNRRKIPQYKWSPSTMLQPWDTGKPPYRRGVPDVSIVADILTGVRCYYKEWGVTGGTSVSVALWASLIVLLNEFVYGIPKNTGSPKHLRLGFMNDKLYKIAFNKGSKAFRPIHSGNNGAWKASRGKWSPCCGLGVPHGKNLAMRIKDLVK